MGTPTAVQHAYVADIFGVDPTTYPAAAPPGGNAQPDDTSGGGPPGAGGKETSGPMSATATELFFDRDSADLTSSDTASLDAYAQAYVQASASTPITIDAYASIDGQAPHNQQLSAARGQAVVAYLIGKGVPKDRVSATGHGPTDSFSTDDPRANRRATISPKPPAPAAAPPPASADPPKPPIRLYPTDDEMQHIVGDVTTVARDQVEKELKDFLTKLQTAQGGKSVKVTDRVRLAGDALSKNLGDPNNQISGLLHDDRFNYNAGELAHKIAALLPDRIPRANFDNFLKMAPKDIKPNEPQSLSGAIGKIIGKDLHKIVSILPKSMQDAVEKGIADAVAAGIVGIVDQAMSGSSLDQQTKNAIHSAVEAAIKQKGDTPMDRKQGGAGSPDAQPTPPAATSPSPPPPGVPGEKIIKTPSANIPDGAPPAPKPPAQ